MPQISHESTDSLFTRRPTSQPRRESATWAGVPHSKSGSSIPRMSLAINRPDSFIGSNFSALSKLRMSVDTSKRPDQSGSTSSSAGDPFGRRTGRRGSQAASTVAAAADPFAWSPNATLRTSASLLGAPPTRPRPPRPSLSNNKVSPQFASLPLSRHVPVQSPSRSSINAALPKAVKVKSNKVVPFVPPTPEEQPTAVSAASTHDVHTAPAVVMVTRVVAAEESERQAEQAHLPSAVAEDMGHIELAADPMTGGIGLLETISLETTKPQEGEAERKIPELRDESGLNVDGNDTNAFPFLGEMLAELRDHDDCVDSDDNAEDADYPAPAPPPAASSTAWGNAAGI